MSLKATPGSGKSGTSVMRARSSASRSMPTAQRFRLPGRPFLRARAAPAGARAGRSPPGPPGSPGRRPRRRRWGPAAGAAGRGARAQAGPAGAGAAGEHPGGERPVLRLALLEVGQQRRGQEQRRVRAGGEPDEQGQRQLLERAGTEQERPDEQQAGHGQQRDDRGVDRAHEGLVDGQLRGLAVGRAAAAGQAAGVLLDLVEHHDRVVERVAQDRQQRDDGRGCDDEPGQRVDAGGEHQVVQQRDDRGDRHLGLEPDRDVDDHRDEEDDEALQRLVGHLLAPLRAHRRRVDLVLVRDLEVALHGGDRLVDLRAWSAARPAPGCPWRRCPAGPAPGRSPRRRRAGRRCRGRRTRCGRWPGTGTSTRP